MEIFKAFIQGAIKLIFLLMYVIGVLGSIGYMVYYGLYHIAIGAAISGYWAFPKARETFKKLKDNI